MKKNDFKILLQKAIISEEANSQQMKFINFSHIRFTRYCILVTSLLLEFWRGICEFQ